MMTEQPEPTETDSTGDDFAAIPNPDALGLIPIVYPPESTGNDNG